MAQVTKLISQQEEPSKPKHRWVTQDALQKEFDYWRSNKILQKMLEEELITKEEFKKIDALNRKTFTPAFAQLMD